MKTKTKMLILTVGVIGLSLLPVAFSAITGAVGTETEPLPEFSAGAIGLAMAGAGAGYYYLKNKLN